MKNDIHPSDRAAAHLGFAEIATEKLDVGTQTCEIGFIPSAEIVYHAHVVPESNESLGKMRADEAGAPRHQTL